MLSENKLKRRMCNNCTSSSKNKDYNTVAISLPKHNHIRDRWHRKSVFVVILICHNEQVYTTAKRKS